MNVVLVVVLAQKKKIKTVNDLNQARGYSTGTGTSTAALCVGGYFTPPATKYRNVELWNGTNWAETTDINNERINPKIDNFLIFILFFCVFIENENYYQ